MLFLRSLSVLQPVSPLQFWLFRITKIAGGSGWIQTSPHCFISDPVFRSQPHKTSVAYRKAIKSINQTSKYKVTRSAAHYNVVACLPICVISKAFDIAWLMFDS